MNDDRNDVPCGLCTQCCYHEHVFLHPERGDDVDAYRTYEILDPTINRVRPALRKRADGGCVYLGNAGCSIHERAPSTCRAFDCAATYERLKRVMTARQLDALVDISPPLQVGRRRSLGQRP